MSSKPEQVQNESPLSTQEQISQGTSVTNKKPGLIKRIYDWGMYWAGHKHANVFLSVYSFLEAIILPLPIDMFLIPIAIKKPQQWFRLAMYATVFSLLGGCVGYTIGYFFYDFAHQFIDWLKPGKFEETQTLLAEYGTLLVILVGFTPLPFKVFSIVFGMFRYDLVIFLVLSFIARLVRFGIEAWGCAFIGKKFGDQIEKFFS